LIVERSNPTFDLFATFNGYKGINESDRCIEVKVFVAFIKSEP